MQVERVVGVLEWDPDEFAGLAWLVGRWVDWDHVVDDAVVVAGSAEGFFEACAVALEVFGVFADDAEHAGGDCVVAEEAAFVVGDHVVDVGPFFDGHGGADAAGRIVRVSAVA
nr:MAG: hypothetical protein [Bacteriophage sp.]